MGGNLKRPLLVAGPDSTLRDAYTLAQRAWKDRCVEMLHIPSSDYYEFDLSGLSSFPSAEWDICISVNEFYINDVRRALHDLIEGRGYRGASLISPDAHIDVSAVIGENVIIYGGCFVGAGAVVGHHTVLRPNVVLSEDVVIGRYVTLEANVAVREASTIGDFTTICANSSLTRACEVGAHCYLNLSRQYTGRVPSCTFFSPLFENPVRVLSG